MSTISSQIQESTPKVHRLNAHTSYLLPHSSLLLLLLACLHPELHAQGTYWQQQVNFIIDVTLNDTEHTLEGFEKIDYHNNSPDTLHFIWFHVWPNAYKNDKTAFSEQLLINDRTDFYFSDKQQRGYINRLDFKINGNTAKFEDHPEHIDILKLMLPEPLAPNETITITTPFHVQLPQNFSRGGHVKQAYQITQWYPKPAVYDRQGWHPMPYLDQGEFYSEFGNYDVRITLPENYVVAAAGELQNVDEIKWLKEKSKLSLVESEKKLFTQSQEITFTNKTPKIFLNDFPISSTGNKSIRYLQDNIHDFAWFADKRFLVSYDTIKLLSGRVINAFSYCLPADQQTWKHSIQFIKDAIHTRSEWLGEYPYNVVSTVEAEMGFGGGMEYPTITSISPVSSEMELDETIAHEVSHNWLYGILATDERRYPWMDEGMNTYYDNRYLSMKYTGNQTPVNSFKSKWLPEKSEELIFEIIAGIKKDQPINTSSEKFNELNYDLIAYYKAGEWMKKLENLLGRNLFDSCMHQYYRLWQFKHPYPEDFKKIVESVSQKNVDDIFFRLNQKGSLLPPVKKKIQLTSFFDLRDTHARNYISISPAPGFNLYDGFMIGAMIHNYQLPLNKFSFFVLPLYATQSKKLQGIAKATYSWYPLHSVYKVDVGASASKFSMNEFQPVDKEKIYMGFRKIVPFVRLTFNEPDALKKSERFIQFKSFFINEDQLDFKQVINGSDTNNLVNLLSRNQVINQLKFVIKNQRVLYPYRGELQVEQNKNFLRLAFTGNYYFNYANRQGGIDARFFAGKFLYSGAKTITKQFETDRYQLNLTGANGYEDYTYSDYFVGRNKFENWESQQIMIRDGGFKVRSELLSNKIGKTDDWLIAGNFTIDIPKNINPLEVLPVKIPIKIFADIGTSAESWVKDAETNRFLFDAGFQISLFKETVNIYIPVLYSKVFKDYFRSTLGDNRFWKTISFSIDIQRFSMRKINRSIPS
ncbi:MAG: M1 family metallopeptidase [Chitinophagaceae bacterium]